MFKGTNFFSAVLLVSKNHDKLAEFYKTVLKVPLQDEQHGDTLKHYGCEMGDLHFAIHPVENFEDPNHGAGSVKLAFEIFDMDAFVKHLKTLNVELMYSPRKLFGETLITALKDPDGNLLEFTQLDPKWFKSIERRRAEGHDLLKAFANK